MKLVCFGDSNTRGYDSRSYLGSLYGSKTAGWTSSGTQQAVMS